MPGKNGVKVVIRTRPTATFAQKNIQIDQDENTVVISSSSIEDPAAAPSNKKDCWKFRYHQVLHNAGQDTVYDAIARDIVQSAVIDGINGTILAYGQTGAGKTFTMIGDTKNYQHRGIAPRALSHVFTEIENRFEVTYSINVSYMEIYNDRIFDLLYDSKQGQKQEFVIIENARGTCVRGLTQIEIHSEKEALDQLFNGELKRTVAEHQLNKQSNRSHCIFTLHISQKSRTGGNEHVIHSKLHLVDLAGSERLKKTMADSSGKYTHDNTIKKESMYINQSLSYLEQCIVALGSRGSRHIPYRQTKLTNVLKDSLGGNCNTLMFACIWGENKHLEETISTLKLAQRMMRVQNETSSIVETDPTLLLKKYERQIKDLKQELNMHDALVERSGVIYDEHTPEQKQELMNSLLIYFNTSADEEDSVLALTSVHQIRELFRQCKKLFRSGDLSGSPNIASLRINSATSSASGEKYENNEDSQGGEEDKESKMDGDIEDNGGFSIGIANNSARPNSVDAGLKREKEHEAYTTREDDGIRNVSPTHSIKLEKKSVSIQDKENNYDDTEEKNDAFKFYKNGPGKELNELMLEEKSKLKAIKIRAKEATNSVNKSKLLIDELQEKIEEKRLTSTMREKSKLGDEEIVDEEEFILMKNLREEKKEYRAYFEALKEIKSDLSYLTKNVELHKMRLVTEFDEWYKDSSKSHKKCDDMDDMDEKEDEDDKLDDGEQFDKLEMDRIQAQDPASLAFFQAQKKMRHVANSTGNQQKQLRKTKRGN